MELCRGSAAVPRCSPFPFPRLPLLSIAAPPSFFQSSTRLFGFHISSTSSLRLTRPQRPSPGKWRCLAAAASSVTVDPEKDRLLDEVQVSETDEPNSRTRLSVYVPPVVCDDCYQRVVSEFMKMAKIPGFRPGKKVPESILIGHVGKKNVQKATVESILKRTLPRAMSFVTGRGLKDSIQIITKFSDMEEAYISSNNLRYDVIVDVAPEIKWVPENGYRNLKINVEIDSNIDAERASKQELKRRHKSLGSLRIVTDRGLQIGDVAVLDISAMTIDQDESSMEKIPSAESKGFHLDTEEDDKLIPGFLDSIIGIERAGKKSFPLVFPKSWSHENLRGVRALFTVECKELFYRDLPELEDSLSEKLLLGCTTLGQVEDLLLQRYLEVEQTARDQATDNAILDQLCKMVEVEIPASLFEEQGRQLYGAKLLQIQAGGMKLNDQQLLNLSSSKAVNEYLQNQRENIIAVIKQNLAVGDIFKRENLELSTEDLVRQVENSIAEYENYKQEYDEERVKERVQGILEGAKVLEWLRARAEIHYVTR